MGNIGANFINAYQAGQQAQLQRLKLDAAQKQMAREQAFGNALSQYYQNPGRSSLADVYQYATPEQAMKLSEQDTERMKAGLNMAYGVFSGAQDQAGWDKALAWVSSIGRPDIAETMGPNFDPERRYMALGSITKAMDMVPDYKAFKVGGQEVTYQMQPGREPRVFATAPRVMSTPLSAAQRQDARFYGGLSGGIARTADQYNALQEVMGMAGQGILNTPIGGQGQPQPGQMGAGAMRPQAQAPALPRVPQIRTPQDLAAYEAGNAQPAAASRGLPLGAPQEPPPMAGPQAGHVTQGAKTVFDMLAQGVPVGAILQQLPPEYRTQQNIKMLSDYSKQLSPPRGMRIKTGPNGETEIMTNAAQDGGAGEMARPTQNMVEADIYNSGKNLMLLNQAMRDYQAEFQRYGGKINFQYLRLKDKGGQELSPEEQQYLAEFSRHRSGFVNLLNAYLKQMSGAAVNPHEMERLKKDIPDPGTGWLDGDSPIEFEAKAQRKSQELRMIQAKAAYALRNGIDPRSMDYTDMPQIMNERGAVLEDYFRRQNPPGTNEEVIKSQVKSRLAQEFGLVQ